MLDANHLKKVALNMTSIIRICRRVGVQTPSEANSCFLEQETSFSFLQIQAMSINL
jgi:hypothetical protein